MNRAKFLELLSLSLLYMSCSGHAKNSKEEGIISNKWCPLDTIVEKGLLGARMALWRKKRLWYVESSKFLLSGFESRPGLHAWQGEHVGKWLHAATLACQATKDPKLQKALDQTVERLLATQLANGYLGTYGKEDRFYTVPEAPKGWDIWTHRYNIYGLLTYEKFNPSERVVNACKKMADLLIEVYGKGKKDITKYGTRHGMSSTTLLESIVMLYERTREKKYLNFAIHIVDMSENNPGLRLMSTMLKDGSVVYPGEGKAYQLMSNLLGYLRLYQCTGDKKYLITVLNGWKQIREKHLLITGGPWSRKMQYNANKECFAKTDAFNPAKIVVENCCTVTWIQMNIQLFELTGQAKYATEAEKASFNHLLSDQNTDGIDWCYYTKPNESSLPYEPDITCCASSGPRALEMFSRDLAGTFNDALSINSFSPSTVALSDKFGGGYLHIEGDFPFSTSVKMIFESAEPKTFPVEFRLPYGSSLKEVSVNGKKAATKTNSRGFIYVTQQWESGDKLSIDLDYELKLHLQDGENKKTWVAFTYGPIALAQKVSDMSGDDPFKDLNSNNPEVLLAKLSKIEKGGTTIAFAIDNAGITLIPYEQAVSKDYGPRTYFECS